MAGEKPPPSVMVKGKALYKGARVKYRNGLTREDVEGVVEDILVSGDKKLIILTSGKMTAEEFIDGDIEVITH